jgi:hypothetical protein
MVSSLWLDNLGLKQRNLVKDSLDPEEEFAILPLCISNKINKIFLYTESVVPREGVP